jgi:hypothetical protein
MSDTSTSPSPVGDANANGFEVVESRLPRLRSAQVRSITA